MSGHCAGEEARTAVPAVSNLDTFVIDDPTEAQGYDGVPSLVKLGSFAIKLLIDRVVQVLLRCSQRCGRARHTSLRCRP